MPRWHVYLVRCRDGSLYAGITNDVVRRLNEHNSGSGAKYTRSRRPVELVWSEAKRNGSYARKREVEIKRMSRAEKESLVSKKSQPN